MNMLDIKINQKPKVSVFFDYLNTAKSLKYDHKSQKLIASEGIYFKTLDIPGKVIKDITLEELCYILGKFYGKVYKRAYVKKMKYPVIIFKNDGSVIRQENLTDKKFTISSLSVDAIVWYSNCNNGFASYIVVTPNVKGGWHMFNLSTGGLGAINIIFNTLYAKYRGKV